MDLIRTLPAGAADAEFTQAEAEMRAELAEQAGVARSAIVVTIYGVGVYESGNHYVMRAVVRED